MTDAPVPTYVIAMNDPQGFPVWIGDKTTNSYRYLHHAMLFAEKREAGDVEWRLSKETGDYEGFVL